VKEAITALIGKHVAARRTERGKTQEEVAKLAGISRQALSEIERGTQAPRWETLYMLAQALRCEVFDLIPSLKQVQGK
jgi:transcriptional regulator with XRE-family HTH domain